MKNYLRAVSLAAGISVVLVFGAINALFMTPNTEWYATMIKPPISEKLHSFLWLLCYLIISVIIGEFLIVKNLQKRIWSIAVILIANSLWCYVFFQMQNTIAALIILIILLSDLMYIMYLAIKHTPYLCFFVLPLVIWYIVLTGMNILIVILNR